MFKPETTFFNSLEEAAAHYTNNDLRNVQFVDKLRACKCIIISTFFVTQAKNYCNVNLMNVDNVDVLDDEKRRNMQAAECLNFFDTLQKDCRFGETEADKADVFIWTITSSMDYNEYPNLCPTLESFRKKGQFENTTLAVNNDKDAVNIRYVKQHLIDFEQRLILILDRELPIDVRFLVLLKRHSHKSQLYNLPLLKNRFLYGLKLYSKMFMRHPINKTMEIIRGYRRHQDLLKYAEKDRTIYAAKGREVREVHIGQNPHAPGKCSAQTYGSVGPGGTMDNYRLMADCSKIIFVDFDNMISFFSVFRDMMINNSRSFDAGKAGYGSVKVVDMPDTLNAASAAAAECNRTWLYETLSFSKTFLWLFFGGRNDRHVRESDDYKEHQHAINLAEEMGYLYCNHTTEYVRDATDICLLFQIGRLHATITTNIPFLILSNDRSFIEAEQMFKVLSLVKNCRRKVIWMPCVCISRDYDPDQVSDLQFSDNEFKEMAGKLLNEFLHCSTNVQLEMFQQRLYNTLVKIRYPDLR